MVSSQHNLVSFWFSYVADCIRTHTPKFTLASFAGHHLHWESELTVHITHWLSKMLQCLLA